MSVAKNLRNVMLWNVGWLPVEDRQPERVDSFAINDGKPAHPLLDFPNIDFHDGWHSGDPAAVTAATKDDIAKIKKNFQRMLDSLRGVDCKEVPGLFGLTDKTPVPQSYGAGDEVDAYGDKSKAVVTISPKTLADRIEKLAAKHKFFDSIEFVGISHNRRGFAAWSGLVAFLDSKEGRKETEFVVPVDVREYDDKRQIQLDIWEENDAANKKSPYTLAGNAEKCLWMINNFSATESDCGARFGLPRGQLQNAYAIARLAKKYPSLKVLDRLRMPVTTDGAKKNAKLVYKPGDFIDGKSLRATDIRLLLGNKTKDGKLPAGAIADKAFADGWSDSKVASKEEVERYFDLAMTGKAPASMLSKTAVTTLAEVFTTEDSSKAEKEVALLLNNVKEGNNAAATKHANNIAAALRNADSVAEAMAALQAENDGLRKEVAKLQKQLEKYATPAGKKKHS